MYFVIYKPRIFPQLSKIVIDNEMQKNLNLILRSKSVVSAFALCSHFRRVMKYLWNFVTNNGVCIDLKNFELQVQLVAYICHLLPVFIVHDVCIFLFSFYMIHCKNVKKMVVLKRSN